MENKLRVSKREFYEKKNEKGEVLYKEQICLQYTNDKLASKILGLGITGIVVAVNVILKLVVIELVAFIGEDTISKQTA